MIKFLLYFLASVFFALGLAVGAAAFASVGLAASSAAFTSVSLAAGAGALALVGFPAAGLSPDTFFLGFADGAPHSLELLLHEVISLDNRRMRKRGKEGCYSHVSGLTYGKRMGLVFALGRRKKNELLRQSENDAVLKASRPETRAGGNSPIKTKARQPTFVGKRRSSVFILREDKHV